MEILVELGNKHHETYWQNININIEYRFYHIGHGTTTRHEIAEL